jgi:hypothetical protein
VSEFNELRVLVNRIYTMVIPYGPCRAHCSDEAATERKQRLETAV